jgi:hypothetical protein
MTSKEAVHDQIKQFHVRMLFSNRQASDLASFLNPNESIVDMVKAFTVYSNGQRLPGPGFVLGILTNERLIFGAKTFHALQLVGVSHLSSLENGRFQWLYEGKPWTFLHAKGLIHRNGNKANTDRFYESLKGRVHAVSK